MEGRMSRAREGEEGEAQEKTYRQQIEVMKE